jgi:hypothetical protein
MLLSSWSPREFAITINFDRCAFRTGASDGCFDGRALVPTEYCRQAFASAFCLLAGPRNVSGSLDLENHKILR